MDASTLIILVGITALLFILRIVCGNLFAIIRLSWLRDIAAVSFVRKVIQTRKCFHTMPTICNSGWTGKLKVEEKKLRKKTPLTDKGLETPKAPAKFKLQAQWKTGYNKSQLSTDDSFFEPGPIVKWAFVNRQPTRARWDYQRIKKFVPAFS